MRALLLVIGMIVSVSLSGCTHTTGSDRTETYPMRIMTLNIRLDTEADGENAWPNRKSMVADLIRHEAPDLIGLQEVLLNQKQDLETALPNYVFVGAGRDDGAKKGEFSPIGWRRDRYERIEAETFWLSPTPAVPGKAWDAALPRIATWVHLRHRSSGTSLYLLNTHFDHVGQQARERSAELIADWARDRMAEGDPVIVVGDFNATPQSAPILLLADPGRSALRDSRAISRSPAYGPPGTFTGFRIDRQDPEPIDHVFVSRGIVVLRHATVTQHWGGRLPSDHYPVVVDVEVAKR